ncbi:hypothetical protein COCCADRAFT_81244 [Bipolaris zeicola 26-R-13]|uniref:Uncharacterized protein n=1 Tax=Cochliobolus carbonum (strain 26-R-13) TaxID=930089 RepID=W6YNL4_COCC2|nr:uncharacterized protein COCCADRAFT_81244 [Bipolaris zeicola 26-R-13]EUC39158.1 hypothetical protein COCCADRAFT_81244 [Bipolaris zeicola 26-R-13]
MVWLAGGGVFLFYKNNVCYDPYDCCLFILFYFIHDGFFFALFMVVIINACIHTIVGRAQHVFGLIAVSKKMEGGDWRCHKRRLDWLSGSFFP